jgi:hypothetical protein
MKIAFSLNGNRNISAETMADIFQAADRDPIWQVRGKAIEAHALLEESLCKLFAHLGNMDNEVASIVFFRISSADVRNKLLEKLFRRKHGANYNLFFNSLLRQLHPISGKRNEIVHWCATSYISENDSGALESQVVLTHPSDIDATNPDRPNIDIDALVEFSRKCNFYTRLCNMFYLIDSGQGANLSGDVENKWRAVFQEQVIYPPPENHP